MGETPSMRTGAAGSQERKSAALTPLLFSTKDLSKRDQFEAWRDFISPTVELSLETGNAGQAGFEAEQTVWNLGALVFTNASMPGAGYTRKWRHLTRDPLDHWCLVLVPEDLANGAPPQLAIRSLATPFEGGGADSRVLTLFIPRDLFRGCVAPLDAAPHDIPRAGLGGLLLRLHAVA